MLTFPLSPHAIVALVVLILFEIVCNIRFGAGANRLRSGTMDRGSSVAVSLSYVVVVLGILFSQRLVFRHFAVPYWILWPGPLPAMISVAWMGLGLAVIGLCLRIWALLTLRHRYTRTLLITHDHAIERGGPYRFVRHPGYLGNLLVLSGLTLSSTSLFIIMFSLVAVFAAYAYRIQHEDRMLISHFGKSYQKYRDEVVALFPFLW